MLSPWQPAALFTITSRPCSCGCINSSHIFAIEKKSGKDKAVKSPEAGLGNIVYVRESFKAQRSVCQIDTRDKSNLDDRAKHLIQVLSVSGAPSIRTSRVTHGMLSDAF